ncbi:MAG TPA: glycosyltransferase family 2 protein [Usitatibacter sp.]|nr:glycosyltransferase family 2 protein [Usitatibacter sp.]
MPGPAALASAKVTSITVAYNPDPDRLAQQLRALRETVADIVVVDNGSREPVARLLEGLPVRLLTMPENVGVARGFNVGIDAAREQGASHVLLLDDDSVPAPGMVVELLQACVRSGEPGATPVAAVGPRIADARDTRDYPFISFGWTRNRHLRCGAARDELISCDFLISSGSMMPMEAFSAVGAFDEGLFIDSVDLEWCCRARARGLSLHGVCAAHLDHRLGDRRQAALGTVDLVVHSPERIYYMTRNRFLLYRRAYVPLKWKLKDVLRWLAKFGATMLFVPPRMAYACMTVRGIRDALAGRTGKLQV